MLSENTKLKTNNALLQKEIINNERVIKEIMTGVSQKSKNGNSLGQQAIVVALKGQVREYRA